MNKNFVLLDKEDNELEVRLNSKKQVICNDSKTRIKFNCSICGKETVFTLKGYISKRGRITADSKLVCRSCNKIIKLAENKATNEANFKFVLFHKKLNILIPIRLNKEGNVPDCSDLYIKFKCERCGKESEKSVQSFQGKLNKETILICNECSHEEGAKKQAKTNETYLKELTDLGLDKVYDLQYVNYVNAKTDIILKCRTCGTVFPHEPRNLLKGVAKACPTCHYYLGEKIIEEALKEKGMEKYIDYFPQHHFEELGKKLSVDFYLPKINTVIEFQGVQHFNAIKCWGGEARLKKQQKNDQRKRDYFAKLGMKEVEIRYDENVLTVLKENDII